MASKDYFSNFWKRQPLFIRCAEPTNVTTVQKPNRIVAKEKTRQVSALTSVERGQLVTVTCGVNALSNHIPPMFIFPRLRYQNHFIRDSSIGSIGSGNASGWMQDTEFLIFLLPIFEDLAKTELLERCLGGHTQNANESFNSTVWRLAPKHLHSGLKIIETAAYLAADLFNEGYASILQVMYALELQIGSAAKNFADNSDQKRIQRQERRSLSTTKEVRIARREALMEENQLYEQAEGLLYGPGIAD
ncbi:hypothetical protein ANTQUA_LOCUS8255, partial [Anthophora quadrimaculata]